MNRDYAKRAAVLSVSTITILGSTAVSPALSGIKSAFPQMSDAWIQMILTLPTLLIIPSCLMCRYAISRMGQKRVLIMGIIIYLIGGLGAGLAPDFATLLIMRGILGAGCGFITPMAQNLISSNFSGEVKTRLTSYSASASYLMGIIASFLVGNLVAVNWRLAFLVYFVALVVMILNIIYLPDDRPHEKTASVPEKAAGNAGGKAHNDGMETQEEAQKAVRNAAQSVSGKNRINVPALITMIAMFGINGAFYTFSASISLFMRGDSIGNESSSGIVVSSFMICGFVVGLIVPKIRKLINGYTMALGCLMMGGGYLILSSAHTMGVLMLAAALVGGSYSILYSGIFTKIRSQARSAEETTTLVTFTTAFMFLGQALSQYILRGVELISGISGYRFRFGFLALILLICMFWCIIKNIRETM